MIAREGSTTTLTLPQYIVVHKNKLLTLDIKVDERVICKNQVTVQHLNSYERFAI